MEEEKIGEERKTLKEGDRRGKAPKEGSPWYENSKYPEKGTQKKGKDPSEKNNPRQDSS